MRGERAAHGVEVNRDAGGHNHRLGMEIGQGPGGAIEDDHSYQKNDSGYRAGLGSIVAAGHPRGSHRIALNDRGKLGNAAHR